MQLKEGFDFTKEILGKLEEAGVDLSPIMEDVIKYDHRWKPEAYERFYYLREDEAVTRTEFYDRYSRDITKVEIGNCYKTKELAEEALFRKQFERKMYLEFKPWECDWEDSQTCKYCLRFDSTYSVTETDTWNRLLFPGVIYSNSIAIVELFIRNNEEDLLRYFKNELQLP